MKKRNITIATVALSASAASFALIGPPIGGNRFDHKTYCLPTYDDVYGSMIADTCDESSNNEILGREINSQGCADDQVAMHVSKPKNQRLYSPNIRACLPPNVAQL